MQIFILIALGTFFVLSVLFFIFYIITRNKNSKMALELKKLQTKLSVLNGKYECAIENLRPRRIGYYKTTLNLASIEDRKNGLKGEPYDCLVHIKEIEKYTNGDSKIQLIEVELFSGYDHNQYDHVKRTIKSKFSSIRDSADIEWLESEESIKELRKLKLEKLEKMNEIV